MQKRRAKQKNRWAYIVLFLGTGAVYLSCVDHWKVYETSFQQVRNWCEALGTEGILAAVGGVQGVGGRLNGAQGNAGTPADGTPGDGAETVWTDGSEGGASGDLGSDGVSGGGADAAGSGNSAGITGSGNSAGITGSGNSAGITGSGNSAGITGSGNSAGGRVPGGGEPGGGTENQPGNAQPQYMTVEDDYFSDAVFIGDSRTVGMFEYGGLEEISTFYASKGLTVYKMFDAEIVTVPGQNKKITVEEALQQNTFAKIYLMIGINEMGTGTVETFMEKYREAVAHLQELQPDAIIYLQGIIKVTAERSAQGDYINNEGIVARNDAIAQLADNEKIFYLDVNPLICDETEGMTASYTFDGVHLKAQYIEIWKDYLKTHAISP